MRLCASSPQARINMRRVERRALRYRRLRQRIEAAQEAARKAMRGLEGTLAAIAACESHGDPKAVSAGGTYRGKFQFDLHTWHEAGGSGDPIDASEAEQDRRAAILYRKAGPGRWPICGR